MHPRIAELLTYIDDQASTLRAAFEAVPPERRGTRPSPDRWSPAENVHHITIVERRLAQRIGAFVEQAKALPPETDATPILPTINTERVVVRDRRFKTSEPSEPKNTDPMRVWPDFEEARRALREVIVSGDGLNFGAVSAPHPALGEFTGYEWIAFVGSHAARHADQIREGTGHST